MYSALMQRLNINLTVKNITVERENDKANDYKH